MTRTDEASRVVHADPARVFAALLDPAQLVEWLPPSGMTGRFERFDPRPGGSYRLVLTYDAAAADGSGSDSGSDSDNGSGSDDGAARGKTGHGSDVVEAMFVDIVPGLRVVQAVTFDSDDPAYGGTMTMTWEVVATPGGSTVSVRADDVPEGISPQDHAEGMASSLAQLAALLEG